MALKSATREPQGMKWLCALVLCACMLCVTSVRAQNTDQSTSNPSVASASSAAGPAATTAANPTSSLPALPVPLGTTKWGRRLATLDKRATPLFWANGITRIDELDEYKSVGLNTVIVRLGWRPSPDGALVPEDLEPPRAFAGEAARRGLFVIYALPAAPFGMERGFRINAGSDAYFLMWTAWTQNTIARLKDTPRLLGWMLPDDPRSLPYADDIGWRKWLHENFASVEVLNGQWQAAYNTLDDVSLESARDIIEAWRGPEPITGGMKIEELQQLFAQSKQQPANQTSAFHPAALALARYRWESYRTLLGTWAQVVREVDAAHLVCTGRLPDYAQLLGVPPNIDVSVPDIRPGVAEADVLTHNPQAIDIARRGNRFLAVPTLSTSHTAALDKAMLPALMPKWADSAFAHGASGLAFDQWSDLIGDEALRNSVQSTLERLQTPEFASLWQQPPVSSAAIVLTPLADGHTLQTGTALDAEPRGLYGFGDDLVPGEPSDLVFALRWGTAFGSIDYLAPEDLAANIAALQRYNVLLMPQALSIEAGEAAALHQYIEAGGIVVADLGLGAWQAGGRANAMPPYLAQLFGVPPVMPIQMASFNLQWLGPHELWPTWSQNLRRGGIVTAGDGPGGMAFVGPVAYGEPMRGAAVGLGAQFTGSLPNNRSGVAQTTTMRSYLSAQRVGNGYAVFAPWRLWNFWRPGQDGFDAFHGDLLSRGATLAQNAVPALVPAPVGAPSPIYSQVVNMPNAIAILNHTLARVAVSPDSSDEEPEAGTAPNATFPNIASQSTLNQALGTAPAQPAPPAATAPTTADTAQQQPFQVTQIQTNGVGDFLWRGGIATFGNQAPTELIGGRPAPIDEPDEWESRSHPIVLHAIVNSGEAKVLQMCRVRAQNTAGGPLSGRVMQADRTKLRFFLWPNADTVTLQNNDFGVYLTSAAPVRVTLYNDPDAYAIAPNSRHRVAITDIAPQEFLGLKTAAKNKAKTGPTQPRTSVVTMTADAQGQMQIETSGNALSFEIIPLP
ncbi:MAG: hypothetical protein JWN98_1544 [Abditibacteriota bacterium]|nr:hypothetical protein [Abditibacteriota bacterium]